MSEEGFIKVDAKTPQGKKFKAILQIIKNKDEGVGLARKKILEELKNYDIGMNKDSLARHIETLFDLGTIEYKNSQKGDTHPRNSITNIGKMILNGKIGQTTIQFPMTNEEIKDWLDKLYRYFDGLHDMSIISNNEFGKVGDIIETIKKNIEKVDAEEIILSALNILIEILHRLDKEHGIEVYDLRRFNKFIDELLNYYREKTQ